MIMMATISLSNLYEEGSSHQCGTRQEAPGCAAGLFWGWMVSAGLRTRDKCDKPLSHQIFA